MRSLLIKAWLFAFLILPLAYSSAAPAQDPEFQESIELFQSKRYAASRAILKRLVKRSPRNALYWFNLGNANFMLEKFGQAETAFQKVESLKSPLSPAAQLYRVKSLRAQGQNARAIEILQQLTSNPSLPSSIKEASERERSELQMDGDLRLKNSALENYRSDQFEKALNDISEIKNPDDDALFLKGLILLALNRTNEANTILDTLRGKPTTDLSRKEALRELTDRLRREIDPSQSYWAFAEALGGYYSNVYPDSGLDQRSAAFLKAGAAVGGRPWRRGKWSASALARVDWDEVLGLGDLKILSHMAQALVHYDTFSGQAQAGVLAEYDFWANEPALMKSGLRGRFRRDWNGTEINSELAVIKTVPQASEIGFLEGTSWNLRLSAGKTIFPVYVEFGLEAQRHGIGDQTFADGSRLPWAFQGWGPGLRLIWKQSDLWIVSARTHYRMRDYFSTTLPDGKKRQDRELEAAATLTRILGPSLSAYFSTALVNNTSTLGSSDVRNENYSVETAFIGFLYDVR